VYYEEVYPLLVHLHKHNIEFERRIDHFIYFDREDNSHLIEHKDVKWNYDKTLAVINLQCNITNNSRF